MKPEDFPQGYHLYIVRDVETVGSFKRRRELISVFSSNVLAEVEREASLITDDAWLIQVVTPIAASEQEPRMTKRG